ncbi:MAG: hypothetical protein NT136_02545 [Candidatus Moranbacteria bacterium]|nr:hypothetical protein [Candidatus Moranbacteria bacterium]
MNGEPESKKKRRCATCKMPLSMYNKGNTCLSPCSPKTSDGSYIKRDNSSMIFPFVEVDDGVDYKEILHFVSESYGISLKEIILHNRDKKADHARQVAMYLLFEDLCYSSVQIGRFLDKRDHTSILHGCKKIKEELKKNPKLRGEIESIKSKYTKVNKVAY